MPISYDGKLYEDSYNLEQGRPLEPPGEDKTKGATQVPLPENNASAGNSEGVGGIVDNVSGNPEIPGPIINDGGQISSGTSIGNAFVQRTEDVLKGIIKGVIQGVKAPGDALQGKLPMWAIDPDTGEVNTNPQAIERAQDLAQFAVLGPAPVAAKMADGTLGSFIGVKAKTFDRNALGGAQVMESNGVHPDDIFRDTGMFRGIDNRWRSEISDKDSKLTKDWDTKLDNGMDKVTSSLPDVLDHPELYKAYPELKDINVEYDPNYTKGAYFQTRDNKIVIGPSLVDNKDVYLHEIQHAIQGIEGFAKGGSALENPRLRFEDDLNKLHGEMQGLLEKHRTVGLDDKDLDRVSVIQKIGALNTLRKKAAYDEAVKNYTRLAGEVEARNVETRALLGPEHTNYPPWYSEDTPWANQIVVDQPVYTTPYGVSLTPDAPPPK